MLLKLVNINFKRFDGSIFIISILISTQPELDVISGWSREVSTEPRGTVEDTACTRAVTTNTVPKYIIRIQCMTPLASLTRLTEVMLTYERWYSSLVVAHGTGTPIVTIRGGVCSCKGPDVCTWGPTVSDANSIYIVTVQIQAVVIAKECIW